MDKEKKKIVRRKTGIIALHFICAIVKVLPFRMVLFLGQGLGLIWFAVSSRHKKRGLDSLKTAFGNEEKELKKILKKSFKYMGEQSLELLSLAKDKKNIRKNVKKRVRIKGIENLRRVLEKGRGVVGVSAHLGNFPLMAIRLKEEDLNVNVMARPMRDSETGDFLWGLCRKIGLNIILSYPRRKAIFESLKALKRNEIITIQMDQNFGTGGVWVKFFGKLAATPIGPVTLAMRSEASLLPIFIVREGPGRHTVFIEKEVDLQRGASNEEAVFLNAMKITNIIEEWVKSYPELWSWIHRRWKSRPTQEDYNMKFKVQKD